VGPVCQRAEEEKERRAGTRSGLSRGKEKEIGPLGHAEGMRERKEKVAGGLPCRGEGEIGRTGAGGKEGKEKASWARLQRRKERKKEKKKIGRAQQE
jgi:hypothetical protein